MRSLQSASSTSSLRSSIELKTLASEQLSSPCQKISLFCVL